MLLEEPVISAIVLPKALISGPADDQRRRVGAFALEGQAFSSSGSMMDATGYVAGSDSDHHRAR